MLFVQNSIVIHRDAQGPKMSTWGTLLLKVTLEKSFSLPRVLAMILHVAFFIACRTLAIIVHCMLGSFFILGKYVDLKGEILTWVGWVVKVAT